MADNQYSLPHSTTVVISVVLLFSWVMLNSISQGAGREIPEYLASRSELGELAIIFLSPLLHQKVEYVLGNLLPLLIIGPFVEQGLGKREYILFSAFTGVGLSVLALGLGRPTVGYSGVTYALTGWAFASTIIAISEVDANAIFDIEQNGDLIARFLIVAAVLVFQISTIATDGASIVAHAGGLVVGAVTCMSELLNIDIS